MNGNFFEKYDKNYHLEFILTFHEFYQIISIV